MSGGCSCGCVGGEEDRGTGPSPSKTPANCGFSADAVRTPDRNLQTSEGAGRRSQSGLRSHCGSTGLGRSRLLGGCSSVDRAIVDPCRGDVLVIGRGSRRGRTPPGRPDLCTRDGLAASFASSVPPELSRASTELPHIDHTARARRRRQRDTPSLCSPNAQAAQLVDALPRRDIRLAAEPAPLGLARRSVRT